MAVRQPCVLDASALIAYLRGEPGAALVQASLAVGAYISTINYAEVLSRLSDVGEDAEVADRRLSHQGLIGGLVQVVSLTEDDAVTIAALRARTRPAGLSLGDRACLATGLRLGTPVLTADRTWATLSLGVTIQTIR
jgi:PIN domain nuclease of toxin-antitoxin system